MPNGEPREWQLNNPNDIEVNSSIAENIVGEVLAIKSVPERLLAINSIAQRLLEVQRQTVAIRDAKTPIEPAQADRYDEVKDLMNDPSNFQDSGIIPSKIYRALRRADNREP